MKSVVLFGVRSPLTVEYEESCHRNGFYISQSISVSGTPRVLNVKNLVDFNDFNAADCSDPFYACAFAANRRRELIEQAELLGLELAPALIDPNTVVARSVRVGNGSFINAGVIIGAVTRIGEAVLINRAASLGHHCLIEDYVSIGPGATLAGNIRVGEGSIIGVGAVILPGIRIGRNCIVAGGSLVRGNVEDNGFVAGNPARPKPFNRNKSSLFVEDAE